MRNTETVFVTIPVDPRHTYVAQDGHLAIHGDDLFNCYHDSALDALTFEAGNMEPERVLVEDGITCSLDADFMGGHSGGRYAKFGLVPFTFTAKTVEVPRKATTADLLAERTEAGE